MVNTFFLLFISSNDQGFAILASKLFGAKKYQELGVLYQRNLFSVANLLITVIGLLVFFSITSQNDERIFPISMIPSVIGASLFSSTKYFLISQNIFKAPTIIISALILVHALLCYIFVGTLGMGVAGISFAKSIADVAAVILLYSEFRFTGVCRDTWIFWTKECMKNRDKYLKRTSELGATNAIEGFIYQASLFVILFMDDGLTEVHEVALSLAYTLFCIPWGMSLSIQAQIGSAVGEASNEKVGKIMPGGIALNALFSLITVIFIVSFRKQIASLFYDDEFSSESLENMLLIYAIAFIFDSFANIIGGVLRVIGKEKQANHAFSVCIVGVAGQWIFGLYYGYGYIGVWLCLAATAFLKFTGVIYLMWTLDWNRQMEEAKRALDEQASVETQSLIEFTEVA